MNIETLLDHQTILENRRSTVLFAVRLQADSCDTSASPPAAAYCLALDVSSSVDSHAFTRARQLVQEFVRHLPESALLALVKIHDSAEAIFDLAPVQDKCALQSLVGEFEPTMSGTNLSAGWLLAREQLRSAPTDVPRKIILLTDGEHTLGVRDEDLLVRLATDCEAEGIQISTIHLGDTNGQLLQNIAEASGGTFHAGINGETLLSIIDREIGARRPLAAQNVRVRLKALDFCESIEPLGRHIAEASDGWLTFHLGDFVAGETQTACFNLTVPLLPRIDDEPCASLADESLIALEVGYELIESEQIRSKTFAETVRIGPVVKTKYPPADDGSLTLREES